MQVTASRLFKNKRFRNQGLWLIDISSLDNINLNVINFASEVTFKLNYEKSFIKNQLVLAVLEKIKSCGRWWGNDLVVMTALNLGLELTDCGMKSNLTKRFLGINQIYLQNIHP